ncbi:DUF885 domain-containing protein [Pseudidiomarina sp.]|uniref:DUF885 domain-containing protein n=1 Tax=Pseudidiomarina sp. TaxID=2081707 RepID=UPI00299D15FD|nr:DUF885 domain-containing protein [Pseudidiomarina sp.]MDX1705469.1 DUF885 domain-containing protein [Pseudidiomarina sp.]
MRYSLVTLAVLGLLAGCGPNPGVDQQRQDGQATAVVEHPDKSESERLNAWFDIQYQRQLQLSPMTITRLGGKDQYGEIDDFSREAQQRELSMMEASVNELKQQFNYDELTPEARESYDIWVYQYKLQKQADEFQHMDYVFDQMRGPHAYLPQFLINFHKVETESDMEAYNSRIEGIARAMGQFLARAKQQTEEGIRPPRFAYEKVIKVSRKLLEGRPFTEGEEASTLMADATMKIDQLVAQGTINETRADELRQATSNALTEYFKPAYEDVISWLESDIENTPEIATGVHSFRNGNVYYQTRLEASTTTDLTPEEIHQLGLDEVARITEEMNEIRKRVKFDGDLQEFFEFIRTDERFFYPDTDAGREAYLEQTRDYLDFINERLPDYFGVLPRAGLVVKRVESFREQDGAPAHYSAGTPDGQRPGVYYVHLSDMNAVPKNEMEAIAYHEGNPGHHMQVSIAQELEMLPRFRTQARFTVYSEGWALYAEKLAKEMGAYQNDYSDFGRLTTELWRAVRLVVDTGLHAKGWTEQEAVDYFKQHTPIAEEAIRAEVQRYLVMPGQATAYKVGMQRIEDLRAKAEEKLGEHFDIKGFHDTILNGGALPLHILERRIDRWIENHDQRL